MGGDQPTEGLTAGEHRHGRRARRQQRGDVEAVRDIVKDDEDASVVEDRAEHGRAAGERLGKVGTTNSEDAEEGVENRPRPTCPGRAGKVGIETSPVEQVAQAVCGLDGQGGLADAADADEAHNGRNGPRLGCRGDALELGFPADDDRDTSRHGPRAGLVRHPGPAR